ncbi:hypothetical protein VNO77_29466 [Canavalia gladiata]|uniref:Uncharacterized protein n=1 Tax=Canavalia gladiata TaxID=3824 RepID=A0AAN9KXT9_CANGL
MHTFMHSCLNIWMDLISRVILIESGIVTWMTCVRLLQCQQKSTQMKRCWRASALSQMLTKVSYFFLETR